METVEQLRKRLRILRRDRAELNLSDDEHDLFDLKEFKLEAQIEAQEFRNAVNSAFRLCRRWEKGEKLITLFEWEKLKDQMLSEIQTHETKILTRIENRIKNHYESGKAETENVTR